jgi:putative zinc finger/helix-turn-helix YgiT family protein
MSELTLEGHLHRRCGGHYALAVEEVTIKLSGMTARVDRAMYRCDKCGDKQHTVEQREEAEKEAVLTMRHHHSLMTGKEIKHFRESIGLSSAQLGELLHGLPKGIVEGWEKGRYLQSPAVDAMLRSLTDREERERRAAKAGLVLPPIPGEVVTEAPVTSDASTEAAPVTESEPSDAEQSLVAVASVESEESADTADSAEPTTASRSVHE